MDDEQMAGSDPESIAVTINCTLQLGANTPVETLKVIKLVEQFISLAKANGINIIPNTIIGYMDKRTMEDVFK